jgi:hypothetical protein
LGKKDVSAVQSDEHYPKCDLQKLVRNTNRCTVEAKNPLLCVKKDIILDGWMVQAKVVEFINSDFHT